MAWERKTPLQNFLLVYYVIFMLYFLFFKVKPTVEGLKCEQ